MSEIILILYLNGFLWFLCSEHFFDVKVWRRNPTRSQLIQIFMSALWPVSVPTRHLNIRKREVEKQRKQQEPTP